MKFCIRQTTHIVNVGDTQIRTVEKGFTVHCLPIGQNNNSLLLWSTLVMIPADFYRRYRDFWNRVIENFWKYEHSKSSHLNAHMRGGPSVLWMEAWRPNMFTSAIQRAFTRIGQLQCKTNPKKRKKKTPSFSLTPCNTQYQKLYDLNQFILKFSYFTVCQIPQFMIILFTSYSRSVILINI